MIAGARHRAVLVAMMAACSRPDYVIELGVLEYYGSPARIDVPRSAVVGESIVVNVATYGACDIPSAAGETDAESDADGAIVLPMDLRYIPTGEGESACPAILLSFDHTATLTFDTPGRKTIRIQGRRVAQDVDEQFRIGFPVVVE